METYTAPLAPAPSPADGFDLVPAAYSGSVFHSGAWSVVDGFWLPACGAAPFLPAYVLPDVLDAGVTGHPFCPGCEATWEAPTDA